MITAGIDVGLESTKVVIMRDGKIIGHGKGLSGGARREVSIGKIYDEALNSAGIAAPEVGKVVATGKGKYDAAGVDKQMTEVMAAAKAAHFLHNGVTTVMSAGADEILVATIDEKGKILEFVLNQKCAAGLGLFLKHMARRLEMTLEEMSAVPSVSSVSVNDACIVFAELDALSLLNHGTPPMEVAAAITDAMAVRANSIIYDITDPALDCVMLVGGLTQNAAFVRDLKARSKLDFVIPEEAEFAGALGAALTAADLTL